MELHKQSLTTLALTAGMFSSCLVTSARGQEGPLMRSSRYDGTAASVATFAWRPQFNAAVQMSVEAWVYREEAHPARLYPIISQQESFAFYFWGRHLAFNRGKSGTIAVATREVPAYQWTHVAACYNGSHVRFYVDGQEAGSVALDNNGVGANYRVLLGGMATSYFKGSLDEVRLWSVARTQADIRGELYREPRTGATLRAVWPEGGAREALAGLNVAGTNRPTPAVFGILPRDLVIPQAAATPRIDGRVDLTTEYKGAEQIVIRYRDGPDVRDAVAYLTYRHTLSTWTLQVGIPAPRDTTGGWSRDRSWIGLLVDPNRSRDALAQSSDMQVQAFLGTAAPRFLVGDGSGRFSPPTLLPLADHWRVVKYYGSADVGTPSIEIQLSRQVMGPFTGFGGLAIGHYEVGGPGDDYPGPSDAVQTSPLTWARVTYGGAAAVLPKATVTVRVVDANSGVLLTSGAGEPPWSSRVFLRHAADEAVLELREPTASGSYVFHNAAVPEGVPLSVDLETCTYCLYEDPPSLSGDGVGPTELTPPTVTPTRVILPPCSLSGTRYQTIEFRVRRPLPRIQATGFSPASVTPKITLRDDPLKVLESEELTISGENFHRDITVYLYDCLELPPASDCVEGDDFIPMTIKAVTPTSVTLALPVTPVPARYRSKLYRLAIKDNWVRPPAVTPGADQWLWVAGGRKLVVQEPAYPLLHGFEFCNDGGDGNRKMYISTFGRNALKRVNPCRLKPMYLAYFPIWKRLVKKSNGSCVGMATTSRLFENGTLDPRGFGANYAFGIPGGPPILDEDGDIDCTIGPPRPAAYEGGLCGPKPPRNLWAAIRRNHGAQFSHQVVQAIIRQWRSALDVVTGENSGPVAVLDRVRASPESYVISMRRRGGGHVVTPYQVIDNMRYTWGDREGEPAGTLVVDPEFSTIRIYDNNYPGNVHRYININRPDNSFHYRWEEPESGPPARFRYNGRRLFTIPISLWETEFTRISIVQDLAFLVLHVIAGDADVMHQAADGRRWGWDAAGNFIEEYDGAFDMPPAGDDSQDSRSHLFITSPKDAPAASIINVRGPDYHFHADQGHTILQLHVADGRAGDQDLVTIRMNQDNLASFEFVPASTRARLTPTVAMEFSDSQSAAFSWNGLRVEAGESLVFEGLPGSKAVRCVNKTGRAAQYTLTIDSEDEASGWALTQHFGPLELPPGAAHTLALLDWPGLQSAQLDLDLDNDGVAEQTAIVSGDPAPDPMIRFMGVPCAAQGDGLVQDTGHGQLIVDRLDDEDGADGATFFLGQARGVSLAFGMMPPAAVQTPYDGFQAAVVHGANREVLAMAEAFDVGHYFQFSAAFPGSQATTLRVFSGSQLVLERRGDPGVFYAAEGIGASLRAGLVKDQLSVELSWPRPIMLLADRPNALQADRVMWLSEPGDAPRASGGLHSLTLTGYQVPGYVITNIAVERPPVRADLDGDGDVDQDDFMRLQGCMTGPHLPLANHDCEAGDLDGDQDVDQSDHGLFQRCYTGPNQAAEAGCMEG